jgi:hypothetical protein
VFSFFRRKRLSDEGQQRLAVALARAEKTIVDTHVENALDVIATVGDELPLERVLEVYLEALERNPERAEIYCTPGVCRSWACSVDGSRRLLWPAYARYGIDERRINPRLIDR